MSYGILNNPTCKNLFEEINLRNNCDDCFKDRSEFAEKDKKNNMHSNLLPGFSSAKIEIPIDVLIIAQSHGGGTFRNQLDLTKEVNELGEYYLLKPIKKYHQNEMRKLLEFLNGNNKSWVFTDLIKCFVWQGKKDNLIGNKNTNIAIEHCKSYLDDQIKILSPKTILCLGKITAERYFGINNMEHGQVKEDFNNLSFNLIYSIFPSRNTADLWVENKGWDNIKEKLLLNIL